ncbi:MAG: response regulator transcription factor [bacterium]|jgi:DNA-binding CsgD family transcriptional regulator|nr:response regulator transcription factor [Curvibacter sp.]
MTKKSPSTDTTDLAYTITPQVLLLCTHTNQELAQIAQTLGASLVRVTAATLVNIERQLTQKIAPDSTEPTAEPPEKPLSAREKELLQHLATGLGNQKIAQTMGISPRTVESHRQNIKRKLQLGSQTSLIFYALREVAAINAIALPCSAEQSLISKRHDRLDPASTGKSTRHAKAKNMTDNGRMSYQHHPKTGRVFGNELDRESPNERYSNDNDHVHS